MIFMCVLPGERRRMIASALHGRTLAADETSAAADGLHRLDRHHARHRLDGAGDLRRDLEAAGQLHLDLGALRQHQHQRDLAVGLVAVRPAAGPSSRLATLSIGASPRRNTRSPLESLAAA